MKPIFQLQNLVRVSCWSLQLVLKKKLNKAHQFESRAWKKCTKFDVIKDEPEIVIHGPHIRPSEKLLCQTILGRIKLELRLAIFCNLAVLTWKNRWRSFTTGRSFRMPLKNRNSFLNQFRCIVLFPFKTNANVKLAFSLVQQINWACWLFVLVKLWRLDYLQVVIKLVVVNIQSLISVSTGSSSTATSSSKGPSFFNNLSYSISMNHQTSEDKLFRQHPITNKDTFHAKPRTTLAHNNKIEATK